MFGTRVNFCKTMQKSMANMKKMTREWLENFLQIKINQEQRGGGGGGGACLIN